MASTFRTADLKQPRPKKPKKEPDTVAQEPVEPSWTLDAFVKKFVTDVAQDKGLIIARARQAKISGRESDELIKLAVADRLAFRWVFPKNSKVYLANREQPVTETGEKHDGP